MSRRLVLSWMKISSVRSLRRSSISLNWDWFRRQTCRTWRRSYTSFYASWKSEKGSYHNGNSLSVYLSNVNFEATYSYVEKARFQICFLRVYSINSMDSRDSKICDYQKKWIHSLKRHSTLISQSGEIQRMMFFNEQKKVV